MRKIVAVFFAFLIMGCASVTVKEHKADYNFKIGRVYVGEVEVYDDVGFKSDLRLFVVSGNKTIDPKYLRLGAVYKENLTQRLQELGFIVESQPDRNALTVLTKLGYKKGNIVNYGLTTVEVDVYVNGEIIRSLYTTVNSDFAFPPETQIRRHLSRYIAEELVKFKN